jgi:hypothetical protein
MMRDIMMLEVPQSYRLGMWMVKNLKPESIIDVGCGPGVYLVPFMDNKIEIFGIDGCAPENGGGKEIPNGMFERVDLRFKYTPKKKYDLAYCIEVAEHLEEQYADNLVEILTSCSDTIFLTAATPGQGGTYHFNEQPFDYWLEKFSAYGYNLHKLQDKLKEFLIALPQPRCEWLVRNSFLLTKSNCS